MPGLGLSDEDESLADATAASWSTLRFPFASL